MQFTYVNSKGKSVKLYGSPYVIIDSELLDWEYKSMSDFVYIYDREKRDYDTTIAIQVKNYGDSDELRQQSWINSFNKLYEIFDYDNRHNQDGKLYTDTGYYLNCRFVKSSKNNISWQRSLGTGMKYRGCYAELKFTIHTEEPSWIKESSYSIEQKSNLEDYQSLDYPYDYSFDIGYSTEGTVINQEVALPTDFRLEIDGIISNPSIYINGHLYRVWTDVGEGEKLVISSFESATDEKQIYLVDANGNKINCINARDRGSYIFEKIEGEQIFIYSNQDIKGTLYLIEKRSEPKWT